ncbi:MAG: YjgN family protein [Gammaproteobacteria bacterium]
MNEQNNTQSESQVLPVEFTGSGEEFFKIWIVNLVLTILTLGIYSAWAKVRTNRYFYGNTRLGDRSFEYLANYIIVGEMFPLAKFVLVLLLAVVTPWIVWRSLKFNARMTSYRNVRFGFYGALKEAYRYLLLIPMIPIFAAVIIGGAMWLLSNNFDSKTFVTLITIAFISIYILVPYIQKSIASYTINHCRYGQGQLSAELSAGEYYKIYLTLFGISILVMIAFFVVITLLTIITGVGADMLKGTAGSSSSHPNMGLVIVTMVIMYGFSIVIGAKAYVHSKIRNYVFNRTQLDEVLSLQSDMTVGQLFKFYLVNILLMIFTLGLAYPWVKVRIARLSANATKAAISGSLDQYVTQQQDKQSALGEEMGDAFDVDVAVDLGF